MGTTTVETSGERATGDQRSAVAARTPGEWIAQRSRIVGSELWTVGVRNVLIATTKDPFTDDPAVTEANARLMAAAPALAEALADVLNMLRAAHMSLGIRSDDNKRVVKARAALASARVTAPPPDQQ